MHTIKTKAFGIKLEINGVRDARTLAIKTFMLFAVVSVICTLLGGWWLQSILTDYAAAFALPIAPYYWICALLMLCLGMLLGGYVWGVLLLAQIVSWMLI